MKPSKLFELILFWFCTGYCEIVPLSTIPVYYEQLSGILKTQLTNFSCNDGNNVGLFIADNVDADAVSIMTDLLKDENLRGIQILNTLPTNETTNMPAFTDTIILMDASNIQDIDDILNPMLNVTFIWPRDAHYIVVLTNIINTKTAKQLIKRPWIFSRLINYALVCMIESTPQILIYNPFNNQIIHFMVGGDFSFEDIFPDKFKDLYGYTLNVTYTINSPYLVEIDGKTAGQDYDFMKSFAKHFNASIRAFKRPGFAEMSADMENMVDLAGTSMFLFDFLYPRAAYPHSFMDVVVVLQEYQVSPIATLLYIFDMYTWLLSVGCLIIFQCLKRIRVQILSIPNVDLDLRILLFASAVFNIIIGQTFQSWFELKTFNNFTTLWDFRLDYNNFNISNI